MYEKGEWKDCKVSEYLRANEFSLHECGENLRFVFNELDLSRLIEQIMNIMYTAKI